MKIDLTFSPGLHQGDPWPLPSGGSVVLYSYGLVSSRSGDTRLLRPSRSRVGKPQHTGRCPFLQIKFYWHTATCLFTVAYGCFPVPTGTRGPTKPKIFSLWPFKRVVPAPDLDGPMPQFPHLGGNRNAFGSFSLQASPRKGWHSYPGAQECGVRAGGPPRCHRLC